MSRQVITLFAACMLMFASCSKQGSTGPQGPQGVAGADGNANVIGTNMASVSSWDSSGTYFYATFSDADITQAIVDNGLVEVYKLYIGPSGDSSWTNLPDISGITSTVFNVYTGYIDIYVQNSDYSVPAYPGTQTFRFVIVPSSMRLANPNTNWHDYPSVKGLLDNNATRLSSFTMAAGGLAVRKL